MHANIGRFGTQQPAPLTPAPLTPYPETGVALQTVVETPAYLAAACGVLSDEVRAGIVNLVAENLAAGVALGGGIRKVRVPLSGRGKRGGARVVFLFAGEDIPVFLLIVFAKNENANLSAGERRR